MRKLIINAMLGVGLMTSHWAWAIDVTCNVGTTNGMLKTAYINVATNAFEYSMGGYMYAMMVSVDRSNDIRGEWAVGGYKKLNSFAAIRMWIARTDFKGAERRILGSGGLTPASGKTCQSAYTQILW